MATTAQTATRIQPAASAGFNNRKLGDTLRNALVYTLLIILSFLFIFPFFWQLTSALKTEQNIFLFPPQWIPDPVMWSNFVEAFSNPNLPFWRFAINTMIIEVGMITGRLISCVLVAYGFARLDAPGKNFLFGVMLATLMLPEVLLQIPRYVIFSRIGWVDTFLPLIVPAWFGEAYAIFLMRQFFMGIPRELDEAAKVDGANTARIIWNVIVPLSMPVLSVITILSFKDIWNEFFRPLLYLNSLSNYTLAIGLAYFNGQFTVNMAQLMAATVVTMIPLVIVFFIGQKAFVEGVATTGLAGR
jgi:ABC-type glycerol-3-phosphate transport system permease component